MADKKQQPTIQRIEPGSKAMEQYLSVGYGMTVDQAKLIIAERDKNPALWPYEEYKKAKAMLAAFDAKPVAVSKRKGSTLK